MKEIDRTRAYNYEKMCADRDRLAIRFGFCLGLLIATVVAAVLISYAN